MKRGVTLLAIVAALYATPVFPAGTENGPVNACQGALSRLLLKLTNQVYHIKRDNFWSFRKLTWLMEHRHYELETHWVTLRELRHMHPVDYPIPRMWARVNDRIDQLHINAPSITERGLSIGLQNELIPSQGALRVIRDRTGRYIVKDGNGRLYAIKQVFGSNPELRIEVQEYRHVDPDIINLLEDIRKTNDLVD